MLFLLPYFSIVKLKAFLDLVLINADSGKVVLCHGNLLEFLINFGGTLMIKPIFFLINVGYC